MPDTMFQGLWIILENVYSRRVNSERELHLDLRQSHFNSLIQS